MKKSIATVTDHAVLRYLERVAGLDVERVRREIGRRVDRGAELGASGVVVDGIRYVLSPMGSVITVMIASREELRHPSRGRIGRGNETAE